MQPGVSCRVPLEPNHFGHCSAGKVLGQKQLLKSVARTAENRTRMNASDVCRLRNFLHGATFVKSLIWKNVFQPRIFSDRPGSLKGFSRVRLYCRN